MSSPPRGILPRNFSTNSLGSAPGKFGSYENLSSIVGDSEKEPVLETMSTKVFDDATMKQYVGAEVFKRFQSDIKSGAATSDDDQKCIASGMFAWAKENEAFAFAHWFFPMRSGGGAPGGSLGAMKQDAFIDLDWGSDASIKPFEVIANPHTPSRSILKSHC